MKQIDEIQNDITSEIEQKCVKNECNDIGTKNPPSNAAKLTEQQVKEIFVKYYTNDITIVKISLDYNVTSENISRIVYRKSWRDATFPYIDLIEKKRNIESYESEEWKDVVGYEGLYQCSNLGRVKSYDKTVNNHTGMKFIPGKILHGNLTDEGYRNINLTKDKKNKVLKLHRIIAQTFIPNPENKPEVNHKNLNKDDNQVKNLEWATRKENCHHAWENRYSKTGQDIRNKPRGEKCVHSKLSERQVGGIRSAHKRYGIGYQTLSKLCGVSATTIKKVIENKIWSHI